MTERDQIASMDRAIGRIEGTLNGFIEEMRSERLRTLAIEVAQRETAGKLESRVRTVENRQHYYSGAGAILGAILGAFGMHLKI